MIYPHTVTVVTRTEGAAGDYNEPTVSESTASSPAYIQPAGTNEEIVDRDTVVSDYTGFFPPAVSLTGLSAVQWDGMEFEVTGDVQKWDNGAGIRVYQSVRLRRITG